MFRLPIYILVVAAIFTPLLASANIVLPRHFSEIAYFEVLAAAAFALCAIGFAAKRIAFPKFGLLGVAVLLWAAAAVLARRDFSSWQAGLPLALAALFFVLQALILHEEEWIRLLRLLVWIGVLLTWPVFLGQAGRIFVEMYAPFFVPLVFLALVFAFRRGSRLGRWWFGGAAVLFGLVLFYVYAGSADMPRFSRAVWMMRAARAISSPEEITLTAALGLLWIAAFWTVARIARRKTAAPLWIAGLAAAFAGQLFADPFLSAWPAGSTLAFILVAALAEWVAYSAKP